jgi:hypothetical protein
MSVRKASRVLRVTALGVGLLFVAHSGCISNLDELSSEYGKGGSTGGSAGKGGGAGKAGRGGGAGTGEGGTSAGETSGGASGSGQGAQSGAGEAGARAEGGSSGDMATGGTSGDAGANAMGGASGAGTGGSDGGQAGAPTGAGGDGGAGCDDGFIVCPGTTECVDLDIGFPDGDGVTHCGTCGETCSLDNASAADCVIRQCVPTCLTGFDDCNPDVVDDGCETAITTTSNCGACGFTCSSLGATAVECPTGRCAPACAAPFADCNSEQTLVVDDGCETNLDVLSACRDTCTGTPAACDATQVCNAGVCGAPQGVVVFSVPFTTSGQNQRYADVYPSPVDLTGAQMTVRIYAPGATGGAIVFYFTDNSEFTAGGGTTVSFADLSQRWTDVTFSASGGTDFDSTQIRQVNLEVISGSSSAWTNPTVIYVDSVRSTNLAVNHTFDVAAPEPTPWSPMVMSGSQVIAGSTIAWADTTP